MSKENLSFFLLIKRNAKTIMLKCQKVLDLLLADKREIAQYFFKLISFQFNLTQDNLIFILSLVTRKPVFGVPTRLCLKPGYKTYIV